jgi:hypothetical protein
MVKKIQPKTLALVVILIGLVIYFAINNLGVASVLSSKDKASEVVNKVELPKPAPPAARPTSVKDTAKAFYDMAPNKEEAIGYINNRVSLPSRLVEAQTKEAEARIAKANFEIQEYRQKQLALGKEVEDEKLGQIETQQGSQGLTLDYARQLETQAAIQKQAQVNQEPIFLRDFIFRGISDLESDKLTAHFFYKSLPYPVKNGDVLFGKVRVSITDNGDISLCLIKADECQSYYL